METLIKKPTKTSIEKACDLIKNGDVVAVPTETVYGLAADCKNPEAIKKIFEAKGRPMDNPLIVHISNLNQLNGIVQDFNKDAETLSKKFWPGPLTIIMPKGEAVCNETCAGLDSVGVRMPANKIAHEIIEKSNTPFAAPSANRSGKPSPTSAEDVFQDMCGRIPLIIDGGQCSAGVESTVISVLEKTPVILRPGVITKEMIESTLNKEVKLSKGITEEVKSEEKVLSPGMKYKHYAPNADITIVRGKLQNFIKYVNKNTFLDKNIYILCFDGEEKYFKLPAITYGKKDDPPSQAKNLFSALRKLDSLGASAAFARCPEQSGISLAVYNRLLRSAGFKVIDV